MAFNTLCASRTKIGVCLAGFLLALSGPCLAQASSSAGVPSPAPYYTFQRVVYQNDGGLPDNHAYFLRFLHHISAHIAVTDGKVEIRVVNFASGVTMLQMARTDSELAAKIDALRAKGVRFLICGNTLKGMGLKIEDLYAVKPEDVVPSGVAEIARLQGQGFVYIHP
ncbi:MAG: DsrE family protein [Formivibrio sp.]|nr:DsrE family protein [Formivibrio sp.]